MSEYYMKCKRCEKSFRPKSKFHKICDECLKISHKQLGRGNYMLCKNPRCFYKCRTKLGYCGNCAVKFEQKKEEYYNDYKFKEEETTD